MSDILDRIRRVETTPLRGTDAWVELWDTLQCARAEIVRLRADVECQRLTDAEREALERNLKHANGQWLMHISKNDQRVIDGLLARLGGGA